jgi:nickel-dependent lactate racemase
LVKTLHPIREITASAALGTDRRVLLKRTAVAATEEGFPPLDPVIAAIEALADPVGFPPLASSVVPGDRVAIAVGEAVPCAAGIARGVVQALQRAGVEEESISIVTYDAEMCVHCRDEFRRHGQTAVQFVVHDPDDPHDLCLVGVTKRGEPVVVNRTIFDADVVLPIGCARLHGYGVFDSLYPRFSSAASIERFRTPPGADAAAAHDFRTRETDEAGWLIGVPMVIEVVPGAGETVAHVVAGEPEAVAERAGQLCRQQWQFRSLKRASLVIATLSGPAQAQSWNNMARALAASDRLVDEGGAVAICSNLDQPLGKSLGRLVGSDNLAGTERRLLHDHAEDSWAAWQLARALQRGPVYLLSQLDAETVEDLGLAPVADIQELTRLASRHESVAVLEDSQHAVVTVAGEEDEFY